MGILTPENKKLTTVPAVGNLLGKKQPAVNVNKDAQPSQY